MICPHCDKWGYQAEIFSAGSLYRCIRCCRNIERKVVRTPISLKRRGKIVTCTVHGRTGLEGADVLLFAVGKPKGQTYFQWWEHSPGLAPSRELVTFTKEHNRKGHLEGWFDRYTESLLDEWQTRKDSIKSLVRLLGWLREGKTVGVACYCHPAKRGQCHLSVLSELIRDLGYDAEEAEPIKYK